VIKTAVAAAVLAVATASGANAATVLFSQDFNSLPQALGTTSVPGFNVITGTVDIVTNGNFGISCVGNTGACLDVDGTPGPGQLQSNAINFAAGRTITVSLDLSGNQRDNVTDDFEFYVSLDQNIALNNVFFCFTFGCGAPVNAPPTSLIGAGFVVQGSDPWSSLSLTFTPASSGSLFVGFYSNSADNVGPLVDNVLVTQAVPEPASWAMLIAGFGLVGAAARRRRTAVAA
jgi:hypothetical protein